MIQRQIQQSLFDNQASNGGLIKADGGLVLLSAGAKDALPARVVNNGSIIDVFTLKSFSDIYSWAPSLYGLTGLIAQTPKYQADFVPLLLRR